MNCQVDLETLKQRADKLDGISYGKTVRRTTPLKASQPSNIAKVRKDIESTKQKLRNLAEREWQQLPNKKSTVGCAFLFICINEANYSL
jgi:hypothetical protein